MPLLLFYELGVGIYLLGGRAAGEPLEERVCEYGDPSVLISLCGTTPFPAGVVVNAAPVEIPAIDAAGDAWIANAFFPGCVTKISPSGTFLSGSSGYTGGGMNTPRGVAIDSSGNAWVADPLGSSVQELSGTTGGSLSRSSGYSSGGLDLPQQMAIDASGNVWLSR